MMTVGKVAALWRYPVKSMRGEEIGESAVTDRGLLGDRAYALLDRETGCIASAKHPRKWSRLLECRAAYAEPPHLGKPLPPLWITLPDGARISSEDPEVDGVLSRVLGREVSLVNNAPVTSLRESDRTPIDGSPSGEIIRREEMALAAPAGTFFDYAPLHLLTTATLDRLREEYPEGRFDPRRFRPNLLIAPFEKVNGFVENAWLGKSVQIGHEVRLHLMDPCPRCVMTTLAQEDLPRDVPILRTVAQHNSATSITYAPGSLFPAVAGVYATLLRAGTLARGEFCYLDEINA